MSISVSETCGRRAGKTASPESPALKTTAWGAQLLVCVMLAAFVPACTKSSSSKVAAKSDAGASETCSLDTNFTWTASPRLIDPISDPNHDLVSIKDPTVVRYEERYHLFATTADTDGNWSLVYLSFDDWEDAGTAEQFYLDEVPGLDGYHAAPHVFYFAPQKLWYLVYQSQHPQYSTTADISDPTSWTAPKSFFQGKPKGAPDLWIDYWVICDDDNCHLFFTADDGGLYRSETTREAFPSGMSDPVTVMLFDDKFDLFEGSSTYKLKGQDRYLTLTEGLGGTNGTRYYSAWVADSLAGPWTPWRNTYELPFAGENNTTFEGEAWTRDISHGELLRSGFDERMEVQPCGMQFLIQGRDPNEGRDDYSQLPYGIGLLTQGPSDPELAPLDADPIFPPEPKEDIVIADGDKRNLISNSGFEEGTDGWGVWGGELEATDTRAHSGERSGLVSGRTASWNGAVWDLLGDVLAGEKYGALAWVGASETGQRVSLTLKTLCGADEVYTTVAESTVAADDWVELRGAFEAPVCDDLQEFLIYAEGPDEDVLLYIDDVVVAHESLDLDALLVDDDSQPLGDGGVALDGGPSLSSDAGVGPRPPADAATDSGTSGSPDASMEDASTVDASTPSSDAG